MLTKLETFNQLQLKMGLPNIQPGDIVRVYQTISDSAKNKETDQKEKRGKAQVFEGQVLARKHGKEIGATILIRKIISGVGVERTFPIHSPCIEKIEVVKRGKARRAKLYYLRSAKGRKARLKMGSIITEEKLAKEPLSEKPEEKLD